MVQPVHREELFILSEGPVLCLIEITKGLGARYGPWSERNTEAFRWGPGS